MTMLKAFGATTALLTVLLAAPAANAVLIGPGILGATDTSDSGQATFLDRNAPVALAAGTYKVDSFSATAGSVGGSVIPFLATGTPSTYTAIWVSGVLALPSGNSTTVFATGPSNQFTLVAPTTVYAGFDNPPGATANVLRMDLGTGVTDIHCGGTSCTDGSAGFDLSVGDVLTGFDTAGNSRTYSFGINISRVTGVPEPGSLALLSLGLFGIVLGARNKRQ